MSITTLGIDTSTDVCCGLARDGIVVAGERLADRRAHAEQLMPMIVAMTGRAGVALANVTEIVVGIGPGPFTGLRVGVVTAQVIAAVTGARVRGVCSLDGIAAQWVRSGAPDEFVIASDARRREVYWARYRDGLRVAGPFVTGPDAVPPLPLGGPGATLVLSGTSGGDSVPTSLDAGVLALVGPSLPDLGLTPLYLRRPDAEVPTKRKSTLLQPRLAVGKRP